MLKRDLFVSSLGNTLEWFDFGLFIFFAPIIGEKFFPSDNISTSTLAALGVFAAGFICRPLGGILFGYFGDIRGRAQTLRISILAITISTLAVGLLPTYATAGISASILFTLLRIIQGISVGGEYSGIMIYLAESAPAKKRGFITSFAATGANIGFLFATLTVFFLKFFFSTETIQAWGWRIPFILIGLVGSMIFYYRARLSETPAYHYLLKTHHIQKHPFYTALRSAPRNLLKIFFLTCMSATFYYVFFGFMPNYLIEYLGLNSTLAFSIESMALVSMLFLVPIAGILGDLFGRKRMLAITATGIILFVLPCFYLLQDKTAAAIVLSIGIATVLSSLDQGNSLTAVVENCPVDIRYTGVAFSYNLGMALFGGTAPFIVGLLTTKVSPLAPAYYLAIMAMISLLAIKTLVGKKETDILNLSAGK